MPHFTQSQRSSIKSGAPAERTFTDENILIAFELHLNLSSILNGIHFPCKQLHIFFVLYERLKVKANVHKLGINNISI